MAPGVISFDLDGTLIQGPFGRVLTDLQDTLAAAGVAGAKTAIQRRHRELLVTDPLAAYDWDAIVGGYLSDAGLRPPFDLIERLNEHVRRGETRILHERTFEGIGALRSAGWRVVVLTNGWRRYQEPILRGIGMLDAVDQLLTADDIGLPKPAAEAFAAARGGATEHVHVGDRIDHDIVGGNRAGARTVLLRPDVPIQGAGSDDDPAVIDYLRELAERQNALPVEPPGLTIPDYFETSMSGVVDAVIRSSTEDWTAGNSVCSTTS
ncbi:HAD family hydrolase [Microlunatus sp. Gsoil 973]|uniref:HAD family hydrolase n=1 Tax=Microlunatus sp. Gsoil 973 TaxID=2672569 RepID=UPI0012B4D96F|nr:HAD family hydrolase [Microlunatus sp. Gsoil 973]QGN32981.1 HAD-IA family hydrolase [Microlunatus sp. Gsoil 973]